MAEPDKEWNEAEIIEQWENQLRANIRACADAYYNAVASALPRGPGINGGMLKRNLSIKVDHNGMRAQVYNPAPHSHLIEYPHIIRLRNGGTRFYPGNPVMRRTYAGMESQLKEMMTEGF